MSISSEFRKKLQKQEGWYVEGEDNKDYLEEN